MLNILLIYDQNKNILLLVSALSSQNVHKQPSMVTILLKLGADS